MRLCLAFLLLAVVTPTSPDLPKEPLDVSQALSKLSQENYALSSKAPALRGESAEIDRELVWLHKLLRADEPLEYRMQLTLDAYLLEQALNNSDSAKQVMTDVEMDLRLKNADCKKFGHGRKVIVQIQTVLGEEQKKGWQICYRWVPTAKLTASEMHFPQPSSPTFIELPPGQYIIHAEKEDGHGNMVKSDSVTVPVGGDQDILWKLPVSLIP
jgi:hypothetical protein